MIVNSFRLLYLFSFMFPGPWSKMPLTVFRREAVIRNIELQVLTRSPVCGQIQFLDCVLFACSM